MQALTVGEGAHIEQDVESNYLREKYRGLQKHFNTVAAPTNAYLLSHVTAPTLTLTPELERGEGSAERGQGSG